MRQKQRLNYRFHNPNSVEDTVDALVKLAAELAVAHVENAMREAQSQEIAQDETPPQQPPEPELTL